MPDASLLLKVSEMKKSAPASTEGEGDKTDGSSGSREVESKVKGEPSSSSSSSTFPDEPQGFTSASEVYSVRSLLFSYFRSMYYGFFAATD